MLRTRTLANPDDPLCGIFVRTDGPPQAEKLQRSKDSCARSPIGFQGADAPEEWEASGEEDDAELPKGTNDIAAAAPLETAAQERLTQKREAWTKELLNREPMIDMGVYTKNRCFRLYLCGKFGNDDPARWAPTNVADCLVSCQATEKAESNMCVCACVMQSPSSL